METAFEKQYRKKGFKSQRRYPNEALVRFFATHYFSRSSDQRRYTRVLEIGCGSGANLWLPAREGFATYGIDVSPTGIELCRQMLKFWKTKAVVRVGNMLALPFDKKEFDAIFDVVSMQHVDRQGHETGYREVFRCLKSGGRFFQWHLGQKSTPFQKRGGTRWDRWTLENITNRSMPLHNNGLTCFLKPSEVKILLREIGFRDVAIETTLRSYNGGTQHIEYLELTARKP